MSGHPRTHQNAILRTYAGLLLISICVYTLMYAPQPMFNSVSRDFGVDKGSTGLLVSVFMLSLAVSPLCVGMLLSRIGVRRAILGASLMLGISGVGIWFAPSFLVLLGIRALALRISGMLRMKRRTRKKKKQITASVARHPNICAAQPPIIRPHSEPTRLEVT